MQTISRILWAIIPYNIALLSRYTKAHTIPNRDMYIDIGIADHSIHDKNPDYSGGPTEDFNLDIVLFCLATLALVYIFICVVYYVTRSVMRSALVSIRAGTNTSTTAAAGSIDNSHGGRSNRRISLARGTDSSVANGGNSSGNIGNNRRRCGHGDIIAATSANAAAKAMVDKWGGILDDPAEVRHKLAKLSPEEQFYYRQGEEFISENPPFLMENSEQGNEVDPNILNEQTKRFIEEEGAHAWEFLPDPNLPNDTIIVENRTEITFLNYNYDASVSTNLPIPMMNRVHYCEFKIFEINTTTSHDVNDGTLSTTYSSASSELSFTSPLNGHDHHSHNGNSNNNALDTDSIGTNLATANGSPIDKQDTTDTGNEMISFGLATSPYPYFRLPGRHHHSIAYDSTGARRLSDSFELDDSLQHIFPKCERGDVIGIGYRTRSGTVFFTRNGKKLDEKPVGGHIKGWKFKYLYPIVGANIPCKIHVNFGDHGFVFIEANVKKWGYGKVNGLKMPPPSYEEYGRDTLLQSGIEDSTDGRSGADGDDDFDDEEEDGDQYTDTDGGANETLNGKFGYFRAEDGSLLPPPPGFEFSTSMGPGTPNENFRLSWLPSEPPEYSYTNNQDYNDKSSPLAPHEMGLTTADTTTNAGHDDTTVAVTDHDANNSFKDGEDEGMIDTKTK